MKFYSKQVEETNVTTHSYTITNTFTVPEDKIEIEAEKIWVEENETQRQKRPSSITIKLMNGTQEIKSDVANSNNNWKVTFSNLAKYDARGNEIQYKLDEEEVAEGDLKFYKKTGSSNLTKVDDSHYKLSITNTFTKPNDTKELKVTKVWEDENGKDRVNGIKLILTGNGENYEQTLTSNNVDSTNSNNWIYTFTNLPKYNANGEEIEYTLSEEGVNRGDLDRYITSVEGYVVTNKLIIKETKVEKTGTEVITSLEDTVNYTIKYEAKIDSGYTGKCKVTLTDDLPYEIDTGKTNNLNGGRYNAGSKTITWEENITPTNGKIEITKQISLVYKNLPLNIDKFTNKVKGKLELENGIKEEKEDTHETIVNFKRNIEVTKVWKGDTGNVTARPENVTIELVKNGTVERRETLDSSNNWKTTFTGLEKYDEGTREEIEYTITESNVPEGYYVEIVNEGTTGGNNLRYKVTNNRYGTIKITKEDKLDNTKKIGGAEFTITKLKEESGKWVEDSTFRKVTEKTSEEEQTLGIAEFKNLEYGKYRIQETKAPEGYELARETVDIEINETSPEVQMSIQNKEKTELPATGAFARVGLIVAGFMLLIVAYKVKKRKK